MLSCTHSHSWRHIGAIDRCSGKAYHQALNISAHPCEGVFNMQSSKETTYLMPAG